MKQNITCVLLLTCPDIKGLVSRISQFIYKHNGNILDLDEHVDPDEGIFSIRVAWDMTDFSIPFGDVKNIFGLLANEFNASWDIKFSHEKLNVAIFVSKYDHCLQDILWRQSLGEYPINISAIISNHDQLRSLALHYGIEYFLLKKNSTNKKYQEVAELKILKEKNIDTIILARYMQILTPPFVDQYPNKIINIHHSFLPAFIGGNPYRQAFERGVKIIGATSHYVTSDLDEGPIITQDVISISHKDTVKGLIRKGRDLERMVLARALQYHFEHRVLVQGRKTIIFD